MNDTPCPHCRVAHAGPCDGWPAQLARYQATRAAGIIWTRPPLWWEWKKGKSREQNDDY